MNTESDFRFLIEQAIKAPSGHNTQPWLFKINADSIEIHPDHSRHLPVVDPENRELYVSLGCAAENMYQAATALNYQAAISVSDTGVITIKLTPPQQAGNDQHIIQAIARRQCNRSVYNAKTIPAETIRMLFNTEKEPEISIHSYPNGSPEFERITAYIMKGNTIQMQDPEFVTELKTWMRYNKKHMEKTYDGLSYAVFGAPDLPLILSRNIIQSFLKPRVQNKSDLKKIQSSSHFILFTTKSNFLFNWINLGRLLERYLLKLTAAGISHAYCNQPCELNGLSRQMADGLKLENEYPVVLLRIGYGKDMPYSPRKRVEDVMVNGQ